MQLIKMTIELKIAIDNNRIVHLYQHNNNTQYNHNAQKRVCSSGCAGASH